MPGAPDFLDGEAVDQKDQDDGGPDYANSYVVEEVPSYGHPAPKLGESQVSLVSGVGKLGEGEIYVGRPVDFPTFVGL